jgi:hypothetical protein
MPEQLSAAAEAVLGFARAKSANRGLSGRFVKIGKPHTQQFLAGKTILANGSFIGGEKSQRSRVTHKARVGDLVEKQSVQFVGLARRYYFEPLRHTNYAGPPELGALP